MVHDEAISTVAQTEGSEVERFNIHDRWMSFVARNIWKYRLTSSYPKLRSFSAQARGRSCGAWSCGRVSTIEGKARLIRSSGEVSSESDARYVAYISLRGNLEFEQMHRTQNVGPSWLTLLSGVDPVVHTKLGDNDTLWLAMPKTFVDQRLVKAEDACLRKVDLKQGLGPLVQQSLLMLQQTAATLSEYEFLASARIVAELVLVSIGGSIDSTSRERSVRASNLARIKATIRGQMMDPDLDLQKIASHCGISLSYLHALFHDDGRTAWEYVMSERLKRARQLLESSSAGPVRVGDVALSCGFTNFSHFSTAFKRAFSVSPREILRGSVVRTGK